jgi:hypothetical protein
MKDEGRKNEFEWRGVPPESTSLARFTINQIELVLQ